MATQAENTIDYAVLTSGGFHPTLRDAIVERAGVGVEELVIDASNTTRTPTAASLTRPEDNGLSVPIRHQLRRLVRDGLRGRGDRQCKAGPNH